jgi:hypothetical protein
LAADSATAWGGRNRKEVFNKRDFRLAIGAESRRCGAVTVFLMRTTNRQKTATNNRN